MIDESTIRNVHDRVDILDVVTQYVQLSRKGAHYVGRCPFHTERTASFIVSPARGTYHCFGCHVHGDAIDFVMRLENKSYPEAIELLANKYGIRVLHNDRELSDEEREVARRREAAAVAIAHAQDFFIDALQDKSPQASEARKYAYNRWGEDYCKEIGIGFAPDSWSDLIDHCRRQAVSMEAMKEAGLIKESEKNHSHYPLFRSRITIPVRDALGKIIAFTARYIGQDPDAPKYINSPETVLFKKNETVFGLRSAAREAVKSGRFIIVEGAPDAITLQSDAVGLTETVAALGTAWSDRQFKQLLRYTPNICFLPDADPPKDGQLYGPGILAVMKNGLRALSLGMNVTVREIPLGKQELSKEEIQDKFPGMDSHPGYIFVKQDPDSFIHSQQDFAALDDIYFPIWYGTKVIESFDTDTEKAVAMNDICRDALAHIKDDTLLNITITALAKVYGRVKLWRDALYKAKGKIKREAEEKAKGELSADLAALREAGIMIKNGCYMAYNDGDEKRISNFTMQPLYHIIDKDNAIRIFRFRNHRGGSSLIEFRQDELINLATFKRKIESHGYFHFKGNGEQLDDIREVMSSMTDSAVQLFKMGWNDQFRLYAFGDGVVADNSLFTVDDVGIVDIDEKKFYLPAFSKMHADERDTYQFERAFSCRVHGDVSLFEYVERLITVFGDNARIAFPYVVATLFHDIIREASGGKFPILNIYGNKGSGKTDLGKMLMAFFSRDNDPPSIANTSIASINDLLSRGENNLVHLDEYKNAIHFQKIEILKQIWGGTGQTKKNMDGDKKAHQTFVHSGVILTGQDMPKRDDALLSRVILLNFSRTVFTPEEHERFQQLDTIRSRGASHLTIQLLKLRNLFEKDFGAHYAVCKKEFKEALKEDSIEDRTFLNWLIPLAAFHTIQTSVDLPYKYTDLFKVCVAGIREQNRILSKNSDVAEFWQMLDANHMQGRIVDKAHFKISSLSSFKQNNGTLIDFGRSKQILYLNYQNVLVSLGQRVNGTNVIGKLDSVSMEAYLKNHPAFLGTRQTRFQVILPNGLPDITYITRNGRSEKLIKEIRPMAMVFDYELLKESYNISLETIQREDIPYPDSDDQTHEIKQEQTLPL